MSADDIGHNSGDTVQSFIDRLERLDEEIDGLKGDRADLLKEAASATGFAKVSYNNVVRERRKSRGEVHATYVEMAAIRRAIGQPDPLLPIEDDEPPPRKPQDRSEPGVRH